MFWKNKHLKACGWKKMEKKNNEDVLLKKLRSIKRSNTKKKKKSICLGFMRKNGF